ARVAPPGCRGAVPVLATCTAPQRVYEVDNIARPRLGQYWRRLAGALGLYEILQRVLIAVLKFIRAEMAFLGFQNVDGELEHIGRHLDIFDLVEIVLFAPYLVLISQRGRQ